MTVPGWQPNIKLLQHQFFKKQIGAKRRNEVIPYNDCFYRNLFTYKYVVLLDVDEIIVPKNALNWHEMIAKIEAEAIDANSDVASINFKNTYFMDSMLIKGKDNVTLQAELKRIPKQLFMLRNVYRSSSFSPHIKSFHSTEYVLILHNHYPMECVQGHCPKFLVNEKVAQLQHYREDCVGELKKVCEEKYKNATELDQSLWRHKDIIESKVSRAMDVLSL